MSDECPRMVSRTSLDVVQTAVAAPVPRTECRYDVLFDSIFNPPNMANSSLLCPLSYPHTAFTVDRMCFSFFLEFEVLLSFGGSMIRTYSCGNAR